MIYGIFDGGQFVSQQCMEKPMGPIGFFFPALFKLVSRRAGSQRWLGWFKLVSKRAEENQNLAGQVKSSGMHLFARSSLVLP
jgi:hypothetical protein